MPTSRGAPFQPNASLEMHKDHEMPKSVGEQGSKHPSEGELTGLASGAVTSLASGSPQQLATSTLGTLTSTGTGALGESLSSLGLPTEVLSAGMGAAASLAQQGLGSAVNLVTSLLGKQVLPKVEYTLEVSDGPDALWQVRRMHLTEALSEPYALTLDLVTEDVDADTEAMLGASVELTIERDVLVRHVCGIIHRVEYAGVAHDRLQVRVEVGPALHLLEQRNDTRLWQDMTVPDVIAEVLEAALGDYERTVKLDGLTASYEPREYIVQYRESDLDFVHRLMEEEGITYWFDHVLDKGKEVLVLEDSNDGYGDIETIDDDASLHVIVDRADSAEIESVQQFGWTRELTSTSVVQRIFDWHEPLHPILATGGEHADERDRVREIYHHGHFVETDPSPRTARKLTHSRQRDKLARGVGNVTGMVPGCKFAIVGHARAALDQQYLLRRVTHTGDCPEVISGEATVDGSRYQNHFECMVFDPANPYRPPHATARPRIYGPQTAIVTGPDGEEIWTDEHGRVKVLFSWDRVNQSTDDTSMWIRVAHHWAGPGFGTFFVPRIGMEVVVEFLEGDPAKPLVNGCVYNGLNPVSVGPAQNKTQSVIRTRSSPGSEGYNEILFEDAKGSERIALHAQKDLNETVENCHSTTVTSNQTIGVGGNQSTSVSGNQSTSVSGNQSTSVSGNQSTSVSKNQSNSVTGDQSNSVTGKQTETVKGPVELIHQNNRTLTITGDQSITVNGASNKLTITSGSHSLDAGTTIAVQAPTQISFTCGGSKITMTSKSITLETEGSRLVLDGAAKLTGKAGSVLKLDEECPAFLQGKGGATLILNADANLSGAVVSAVGTDMAQLACDSSYTATPAGLSLSGNKVDVSATGVATVSGAMVKIN
jgi:type VI secretion system secreted protein VgrG